MPTNFSNVIKRFLHRAVTVTGVLCALLGGVKTLSAQPINVNSTITGTVFGDTLTLKTGNAFAGAISSLKGRN